MIFVERSWDHPVVLDDVQALEDKVAWCLEQYQVRFLHTYFSRDRTRMVCAYDAPDAEAVRRTQRTGGLPFSSVWAGESLLPDVATPRSRIAGDKTLVVVQRTFTQPLALDSLREMIERRSWCFDQYDIELVDSYLAGDGRASLCVLVAPDAEAVRRAERTSELDYDHLWPATFHAPPAS